MLVKGADMKTCPHCSKQIDPDSVFCSHCGKRLNAKVSQGKNSLAKKRRPKQQKPVKEVSPESVEITIPNMFGDSNIMFETDCVRQGNTVIRYDEIQYVLYYSTRTSVMLIPSDQSYQFSISSAKHSISVYSSAFLMIGRKQKEDIWMQLIMLSKYLIEPRMVISLADKIFKQDQVLKFDKISISKIGYCKKGFFSGEKWVLWKSKIYEPELFEGKVILFDSDGKEFESIGMDLSNAVLLPELVVECYRRANNL